jgi:hypothetical protein
MTELIARRTLRGLLSDYKRSSQPKNGSLHGYRKKFARKDAKGADVGVDWQAL